jgi:CheY-like chemotaxis protein
MRVCILTYGVIEMPVMRGRDAVRKMRESGYNSIVLGVTGNAKDEEVADFKCNGASEL